ncbi:MAG TPA: sigma factor [Mycobacteriales bacterium]|nr:sigma factor [Mycobacteriales bacterium]
MTRPTRPATDRPAEADLLAVAAPVRQVVSARLGSPVDVEDAVQETLVRVWAVRSRLERAALLPYAVAVARNLVSSAERGRDMQRRNAHRLAEPAPADDPAVDVLAAEERAALLAGLAAMREQDRRLLLDHEVTGVETGPLAAQRRTTAGAVAARLARARARLRVEHLLALRHVDLPTPRCRAVLDALSLADRRRQRSLRAAEHLVDCATCADLAPPLLTRRRALTALAPVGLLLGLPARAWAWVRGNPGPATVGAAGATAVAVAVAMAGHPPAPPPPPPPRAAAPATVPATLSVDGVRLLPADRVGSLRARVGRRAVAHRVPVQSVPADEGFWVGGGPGRRVWVQLATRGESRISVRPGQVASFTATVLAIGPGFPAAAGVGSAAGAAEIRATGAYLLVDPTRLSLG